MRDGEAPVDPVTNHSSIYGPRTVCTNERQYTGDQLRSTNRTFDLDMERHSALPTARRDGTVFLWQFFGRPVSLASYQVLRV
jgi:hypothetical protein